MKIPALSLALALTLLPTGCKRPATPSATPSATPAGSPLEAVAEPEIPVPSPKAPERPLGLPDAAALAALAETLDDELRVFSPPSSDRAFWTSTPLSAKEWREKAERYLAKPIPELTEELYRDFEKTGRRDRFEAVAWERLDRAATLGVAEALENQGRFIAPLRESIEAILNEPSWVMNAHDFGCLVFSGKKMDVDLGAADRAAALSTLVTWHGAALGKETVERVRGEVRRRVVEPFRKRIAGDTSVCWWAASENNWNAVCLAGIVYSTLATEPDKAVRAEVVGAAMSGINRYLNGFTMDGSCSEGIGYWQYGFGHFVLLAERLWLASGGKINLYQDPVIPSVAALPSRLELTPGVYPTFADGKPTFSVDPWLPAMLSRRISMEKAAPADRKIGAWSLSQLDLQLAPPPAPEKPVSAGPRSALRGYFDVAGILVSRPADPKAGLCVAMKGGHNAEMHNHNDLGSYVVTAGSSAILVDPGAPVYTSRTFGEHRYESNLLNSYGHPVPVVDGQLQATGRQAQAGVLKTRFTPARDEFSLDLTSAYPVKGLTRLTRSFTYDRGGRTSLQIEDELQAERPMTFENALITLGTMERKQDGSLYVSDGNHGGVRVVVDTGGVPYDIKEEVIQEQMPPRERQPRRIAVRLTEPVAQAKVKLTVTSLLKSAENEVVPAAGVPEAAAGRDGVVRIEAEDFTAEEGGHAERADSPSSGGTIRSWDRAGHALEWKVQIPREGRYLMLLRQANGAPGATTRALLINGAAPSGAQTGFAFPPTGGWGLHPAQWQESLLARNGKPFRIRLAAGENTIRMVNTEGGGLNLDWLALIPLDQP